MFFRRYNVTVKCTSITDICPDRNSRTMRTRCRDCFCAAACRWTPWGWADLRPVHVGHFRCSVLSDRLPSLAAELSPMFSSNILRIRTEDRRLSGRRTTRTLTNNFPHRLCCNRRTGNLIQRTRSACRIQRFLLCLQRKRWKLSLVSNDLSYWITINASYRVK